MTVTVDFAPWAHPMIANLRPLAGVLAPREQWSERDLGRLTKQFATRAAEELHQLARFDLVERWRLPLARTEQVEVWLLTWTPWQGIGPHDHDGTAGAYTVLLGELTGTWRDGRGRAKQAVRAAGSGATIEPGRIHSVQNRGTIEAISVHAYSR
jgi:predicted metal-dependent enzyme (double-stranded beta helix superfamily)